MARNSRKRRKPRNKSFGKAAKTSLFLLVLAAIGAGYAWHEGRSWRPDETLWPEQGAFVGASQGVVDFSTIAGLGAKFVYLEASDGAGGKDAGFAQNFARARGAGLEVGAAHRFDPCAVADGQSANFVTMVPRDAGLLPPAIILTRSAQDCPSRVSAAAVQSELTTLVNQIESHTGKPAILAPDEEFEETYATSRRFERQLWLSRSWFEPEYATRPWLMWTANRWYQTEAARAPLRWVVVQP